MDLGSVVGVVGALGGVALGAALAARNRRSEQQERLQLERQDRARQQLAEVVRLAFQIEYLAFQTAWLAKSRPAEVDSVYARRYEKKMSKLMPELSGAMVVLAGLSRDVHAVVLPWAEELWAIEGDTERVLLLVESEPAGVGSLARHHEALRQFYAEAPSRLSPAYELLESIPAR